MDRRVGYIVPDDLQAIQFGGSPVHFAYLRAGVPDRNDPYQAAEMVSRQKKAIPADSTRRTSWSRAICERTYQSRSKRSKAAALEPTRNHFAALQSLQWQDCPGICRP